MAERTSYFVFSAHRTREAAEQALEDYFASGETCEGEHPKIETQRRVVRDQTVLYRTIYCVMFPGD